MTQIIRKNLDGLSSGEPILHGLTEVEFVRDILSTWTFDPGSQQEILGFETRILKRHLRKVIIGYTLKFRDSTKNYIGLYRESDERLGHTFSVLKTLRSNGFGADSRLRVPSPIIYIPALSFLMMEQAEGESLREVLKNRKDPQPYVKGAARWLAILHNSNITLDGESSRDYEIATSQRYARAGSWLLPTLKLKIQSISAQLIDAQKTLQPYVRKPIHGDYHPRNIIVDSDLTTVIDFEEARMGDPAFDVGYFTAQTKMTHGRGDVTVQALEAFLEEYQENQPNADRDLEKRAAIFEAQTYLQRIYHTYYLLALRPDFDLITEWLNESQGCLRRAQSDCLQTGRRQV
jgi:aminoglycoside phosphotransferase (APT) family kinase protein